MRFFSVIKEDKYFKEGERENVLVIELNIVCVVLKDKMCSCSLSRPISLCIVNLNIRKGRKLCHRV